MPATNKSADSRAAAARARGAKERVAGGGGVDSRAARAERAQEAVRGTAEVVASAQAMATAAAAEGRATVKLSDNPRKAMGPEGEVARYKRVFGVGEQDAVEVVV